MNYSLFTRDGHLVIKVYSLQNEYDNRLILRDLEQFSNGPANDCIVDLASISYINSSGINFLINLYNRFQKADKKVVLQHASRHITKLLEVTKLSSYFPVLS